MENPRPVNQHEAELLVDLWEKKLRESETHPQKTLAETRLQYWRIRLNEIRLVKKILGSQS